MSKVRHNAPSAAEQPPAPRMYRYRCDLCSREVLKPAGMLEVYCSPECERKSRACQDRAEVEPGPRSIGVLIRSIIKSEHPLPVAAMEKLLARGEQRKRRGRG